MQIGLTAQDQSEPGLQQWGARGAQAAGQGSSCAVACPCVPTALPPPCGLAKLS